MKTHLRPSRSPAPWLIAALGIAVSCLVFALARQDEARRIHAGLESRADWLTRNIERAIGDAAGSVTAMAAYVGTEQPPPADRFRQMAEQIQNLGGPLHRVVWQPRVSDEQRAIFEAAAPAAGGADFQIRDFAGNAMVPAERRPEYFPLLHDVQFGPFPHRSGFDMSAVPERREAMARARDQGGLVAALMPLMSASNRGRIGYFIFWPIYRGGAVPATLPERREKLAGYVTGIFALAQMLEDSIGDAPDRIETIRFLAPAGGAPATERTLLASFPPPGGGEAGENRQAEAGALRVERAFTAHQLTWTVAFDYAAAIVAAQRSPAPWAYLGLGLALTALLWRQSFAARRALISAEHDQRRTSLALSESEQRFRGFAEIASDWMWELDADLRFTWFSDSAVKRNQGNMPPLGTSVLDVPVVDANAPGLKQMIASMRARQPFQNLVYGRFNPDGSTRFIRVSGAPRFEGERFLGYRGATTDVTVEVETRARLAEAIEALPAGFLLFDRKDRLIIANSMVRRIFAKSAACFEPGVPFAAIVRTVAETQAADAAGHPEHWARERLRRFHGGDGEWPQELEDGRTLQVVERRTSDGGKLIIYADVTKLTESEQRLRVTLDAVPSGLMVVSADGTIVRVNNQLELLTGYARRELVGGKVEMLLPDRYRHVHAKLRAGYMRAAGARPMGVGRDLHARRRDGSEFPVEIGLSPVRTTAGEFVIASIFDISARKQMEETLRQSQKMEVVGQLTGGVAHDFNNLLSVIVGNLELLAEKTADAVAQRRLRTVLRAANRGAELTHRLLAFSRRQNLQPQATPLPGLFADLKVLLARTIGEAIAIDTTLAPDLPACMVDRGQLENAILNLVINARDAMPNGGRVTLVARHARLDAAAAASYPEATPGNYIEIVVADEGEGMTEEVRRRAFEPFFTTKSVGGGSGLGLSMVYGFVKQSGGFVALESRAGKGTTVRLFLPQATAPTEPEAGEDAAGPPPRRGAGVALVVEDQPDVREASAMRLGELGFTVLLAADGPSALAIVESRDDIRLLFSDVVMPGGMDGFALAGAVRKLRPEIRILLTTGYAGGKAKTQERILFKPYGVRELAKAVDAALAA